MALFISMRKPLVDLDLALVVDPRHAEHDDALGLDDPLEDLGFAVLGMALEHGLERLGDFLDGLMELGLALVLGHDVGHELLHVVCLRCGHTLMQCPPCWVADTEETDVPRRVEKRRATTSGDEEVGLSTSRRACRTARGLGAGRGEYTTRRGGEIAGQCAKAYKLGRGALASADKAKATAHFVQIAELGVPRVDGSVRRRAAPQTRRGGAFVMASGPTSRRRVRACSLIVETKARRP